MTRTRGLTAALAGAVAITAGAASAATPVQGSIVGPVVAVKGKTFTVTTPASLGVPKNRSTVTVASSTVITEQATGTIAEVKKGLCTSAFGTRNSKGVVAAQRITLTEPVKGSCTTGFGGRGRRPGGSGSGAPPRNGERPPGGGGFFGGSGNVGFAFGSITAVKGSTVTVKGPRGTTTVTISKKTSVERTLKVGLSAVKLELCAFVRGTSWDKGATVNAQSVALSQPVSGGCTGGFRRPQP